MTAALPATETVKTLTLRKDDERRSLFLMEGAETLQVATRLPQDDFFTDDLGDVQLFPDF